MQGLCHICRLPFGVCGKTAGKQAGTPSCIIPHPIVCMGGNYNLLPATSSWQTCWDSFPLDLATLYGKGKGILQMNYSPKPVDFELTKREIFLYGSDLIR